VTAEVSVFEGTAVLYLVNTTLTVAFNRIRSSTTGLTTTASINAQSAKTANITSDLTANSTLNCTISHILGADIVAGNFATLTASGDSVKEIEVALSSSAAVASTANRIRFAGSTLSAVASSSATPVAKKVVSATVNSEFALVTVGKATRNAVSNQSQQATLTCVISHIEGANIVANNFATASADITKFAGASSQLTLQFTVSANTQEIQNVSAGLTTAFSVTVTPMVFSDFNANLQSTSTVTAGITAFVGVVASLQVTGFTLAEGKEIRLDNIVYVIPPESRLHTITSETRLYKVGSETRIYKLRRA